MIRNYLSRIAADKIITLLATIACNIKELMNIKKEEVLNLIFIDFSIKIFWCP